MDDVVFSYHRANGPESSTMLYFEEVRQVVVPVMLPYTSKRIPTTALAADAVCGFKPAFHDTDTRHRHPREDRREDVGIGVVDCELHSTVCKERAKAATNGGDESSE